MVDNNNAMVMKPPNILVYTGEHDDKYPHYLNIVSGLKFCLDADCYTMNLLLDSQVTRDPWQENCAALVVSGVRQDGCPLRKDVSDKFQSYAAERSSLLLNFCTNLELPSIGIRCDAQAKDSRGLVRVEHEEWKDVAVMRGDMSFTFAGSLSQVLVRDSEGSPVVYKSDNVLVSEVHFELDPVVVSGAGSDFETLSSTNNDRLSILRNVLWKHFDLICDGNKLPEPSPCFTFAKNKHSLGDKSILNNKKPESFFVNYNESDALPEASSCSLPIYVDAPDDIVNRYFNRDSFFKALKTQHFGRRVFFVDVVSTTMDVLHNLQQFEGSVIIASLQTSGIGRGFAPDVDSDSSNSVASPNNNEKKVIGPLCPAPLQSNKSGGSSEGNLLSNPSESLIGPCLPPGFSKQKCEEEDDWAFGPMPASESCEEDIGDVLHKIEDRAKNMKRHLDGADVKIEKQQREEWMTVPNTSRKNQLGVISRCLAGVESRGDSGKTTSHMNRESEPIEVQKEESRHSKAKQPKSLLEIHQKKLKKKKKQKDKEREKHKDSLSKLHERKPFDRDAELSVRMMNKDQVNSVISKSKYLNSRFSAGASKFL